MKSTGNESICGSALHRNTAIPGDYTEQAIRERIAGTRRVTPRVPLIRNPHKRSVCWWILKRPSVPEKVLVMNVGRKYSILNNFFRRCFI